MNEKTEKSQNMDIDARIEAGYWLPQYSTYKIMRTTTFISTLLVFTAGILMTLFSPADSPRLLLIVVYLIAMSFPVFVFIQRKEVPTRYDKIAFTGRGAIIFSVLNLVFYIGVGIYLVSKLNGN